MKNSLILILSVALLLSCKSGNNNTNTMDSVGMGDEVGVSDNNSNDNNNLWDQDKIKTFVDDAAAGSLMDVELGKVAQKNAMSQQVRDFGKMMEKDHGDASTNLKSALQPLGLNVPSALDKDHQDKIDNLNKRSGKEFDKDYIDEMVSNHKKDVDDFEDAQNNLPSGELRTWVENTLPVLRQHLTQAQTIQDQLKNNN